MTLKYLSVCSGIEAATVAWSHLGWTPFAFSEIEKFPNAVLAHHYPGVENLGDMTEIDGKKLRRKKIDLIVGGTPCQAFSVAGLRKSLDDGRGNLTLKFVELCDDINPRWVVWENVPGVLNTKDNAFGCFLGALSGEVEPLVAAGKKWTNAGFVSGPKRRIAWRTLDAQYFGLAQRRRRVFVVACPGDGGDPREVLFEREGVQRDTPPSREEGEGTSASVAPSLTGSGRGVERTGESRGQDPVVAVSHDPAVTLTAREKKGPLPEADLSTVVAHSLRGESFDASEDGTGRGTPLVPVAGHHPSSHQGVGVMTVTTLAIRGRGDSHQLETREDGTANALLTPNGGRGGIGVGAIHYGRAVRRLTPRECERLQGFPDDYTMIPWRNKPVDQCPDGPRYKALGNSMAVPCMEWIGEGIDIVEEEANG